MTESQRDRVGDRENQEERLAAGFLDQSIRTSIQGLDLAYISIRQ